MLCFYTVLPIGGAAKRLKDVEGLTARSDKQLNRAIICTDRPDNSQLTSYGNGCHNFHSWPGIPFLQAQPLGMNYSYATSQHQRLWCKHSSGSNSIYGIGMTRMDYHLGCLKL